MRFNLEIEINSSRDQVVELFLDPDNLSSWQPELISYEQIKGDDPRAVGSVSKHVHKMGRHEIELIETIIAHDPPGFFAATYEAKDIWNSFENNFSESSSDITKWTLDADIQCSGFMMRMMTLFAPFLFKRQTKTSMMQFKEFVESQTN